MGGGGGRPGDRQVARPLGDVHSASHRPRDGAGEPLVIRVIPGAGTGELEDLRGTLSMAGDVEGGHAYTIDYDLGQRFCG